MKPVFACLSMGVGVLALLFVLVAATPAPARAATDSQPRWTGPAEEPGFHVGGVPMSEGLILARTLRDAGVDGGASSCSRGYCGVYVPFSQRFKARAVMARYDWDRHRKAYLPSDDELLKSKPNDSITFSRLLLDNLVMTFANEMSLDPAPVPCFLEGQTPILPVESTSLHLAAWETMGRRPEIFF